MRARRAGHAPWPRTPVATCTTARPVRARATAPPLRPTAPFARARAHGRRCLVVITAAGRLNDAEKKALQDLAQSQRQLRVVRIDASKANFFLDLPSGALPAPNQHKATVVLLKELEGGTGSDGAKSGADADAEDASGASSGKPVIAAHLAGGLTDASQTASTIAKALVSTEPMPSGFAELVKRPALRPKRVPPPPPKQQTVTPEPRKSSSDPAGKTLTDEELKKLRDERQRAIKEAELQRRAAMAKEEADASNIVEETESVTVEGDDDADGAAEEEIEVEAEEFD